MQPDDAVNHFWESGEVGPPKDDTGCPTFSPSGSKRNERFVLSTARIEVAVSLQVAVLANRSKLSKIPYTDIVQTTSVR